MNFRNFLEMARGLEGHRSAVPIFDGQDQNYYKYLIDQAPSNVKNDPELLATLIRVGICLRYGKKSNANYPGLMVNLLAQNKDYFDKKFNLKNKHSFEIKNIPAFPKQWAEKITERGWNLDDDLFGYANGNCSSRLMQDRAARYIKFFKDGTMPPDKDMYFHAKYNASAKDSSQEDKIKAIKSQERGSKKSRNFEEFEQKSMEGMKLEDEDLKYLSSVEEKYKEANPEEFEENRTDVLAGALGIRYSNHWVKEENGEFKVRDVFKSPEKPQGQIFGDVAIPFKRGVLRLNKVYLNLPWLAERLQTLSKKNIKNFVKEPMLTADMVSRNKFSGLTTAKRWLQKTTYNPNGGTKGTETIYDKDFYEQIQKDWDAWRKRGDNAFAAAPALIDPEIEEDKLTWRKDGKIVESPNINDLFERNTDNMTWNQILEDDVKRGVYATIAFLSRKKNDVNFSEKMKDLNNLEQIMQAAKYDLMFKKTGVNPELYRKESERTKWVRNSVARSIKELLKGQAIGADDEKDYDTTKDSDPSMTKDTGRGHFNQPEEKDIEDFVNLPGEHQPQQKPEIPLSTQQDWEDYLSDLGKQNNMVLTKPANVKITDWIKMNREQKLQAMKGVKV